MKRRGKSSPLDAQAARQEKPHAVQDKTEEGQPVRRPRRNPGYRIRLIAIEMKGAFGCEGPSPFRREIGQDLQDYLDWGESKTWVLLFILLILSHHAAVVHRESRSHSQRRRAFRDWHRHRNEGAFRRRRRPSTFLSLVGQDYEDWEKERTGSFFHPVNPVSSSPGRPPTMFVRGLQ